MIAASLPPHTPATIITSPFQRCAETALGLAPSLEGGPAIYVDGALSEHLRAEWFNASIAGRADFLLSAEALRAALAPSLTGVSPFSANGAPLGAFSYPEDDAALEVRAAAVAAAVLARAAAATRPLALVLVTHGGVAGAIARALANACGVAEVAMPHMGYAALSTLKLRGGAVPELLAPPQLGILPLRLTEQWFAHQKHVWDTLLQPILRSRMDAQDGKIAILEVGSWEGASAAWLLVNGCSASAESRLTCVDHFDKLSTAAGAARAEKFQHNTRVTGLWPRVEVLADFSVTALQRLLIEKREWDCV